MSQNPLQPEWLKQLSDPYAVLGISVAADDRRILKRYRQMAKLLHPDRYNSGSDADKQLATQLFARLINPAYEKLKQQKSRAETMALLRLSSRSVNLEIAASSKNSLVLEMVQIPAKEIEVFYEQAISTLAESQYQSLDQFHHLTQQLSELNLLYLRLKTSELLFREKRTGLIPAAEAKPIEFIPVPKDVSTPPKNYAHSHYQRAVEYAKQKNWAQAVQELRDAIKLEGGSSQYHALIGYVYLKQDLPGMATAHIRQALKLNPEEPLALRCAPLLNLQPEPSPAEETVKTSRIASIFKIFLAKKRPQVKC